MGTYPGHKVISLYASLGGLIGGALLGILAEGSNLDSLKEIPEFLGMLLLLGVLGIFFGLIPAALTGWIIARCRLYQNIWWHYPAAALIGFLPSGLWGVQLILTDGMPKIPKMSDFLLLFGVFGTIGAVSALLLAPFVLPKNTG